MQEEEKLDRFMRGLVKKVRMQVLLQAPADLESAAKVASRIAGVYASAEINGPAGSYVGKPHRTPMEGINQ